MRFVLEDVDAMETIHVAITSYDDNRLVSGFSNELAPTFRRRTTERPAQHIAAHTLAVRR